MAPQDNNRTCGRPSWVFGTKLTFLSQYSDDWRQATDKGLVAAGNFYTKVTKRFIKKYGWDFDHWTDKVCVDLDPDTMDDDETQEGLSEQEVNKRHEYFRALRGVSINHLVWIQHMANDYYSLSWCGFILITRKSIQQLLSRSNKFSLK